MSPNLASSKSTAETLPIEIAGVQYVTPDGLALLFRVSRRTVSRWTAQRIGPPHIKIGKMVLFELDRIPQWLSTQEIVAPQRRIDSARQDR